MSKKFIELSGHERETPVLFPPAGHRDLYAKADGWYDMDSTGEERRLSNDVPGETGPQHYRAVLTAANGSYTSTSVGHTDFSDEIVWARSGEGVYTGTLVGAFADVVTIFATLGTATNGVIVKGVVTSNDVVTLSTFLVTDGTTAADFIGTLNVQIISDPIILA